MGGGKAGEDVRAKRRRGSIAWHRMHAERGDRGRKEQGADIRGSGVERCQDRSVENSTAQHRWCRDVSRKDKPTIAIGACKYTSTRRCVRVSVIAMRDVWHGLRTSTERCRHAEQCRATSSHVMP